MWQMLILIFDMMIEELRTILGTLILQYVAYVRNF